jgi:aminocarboxymuconate-semialdehyde decarboxylase
MSPVIDVHAHIVPPGLTREADPADGWRPHIYWQDGQQVIEFAGKEIRSAIREFVNIEGILEEQERAGVDRVLLAPWVSIVRYDLPSEAALEYSMAFNQELAELSEVYADRMSALGTVPLQDPALAAEVLESSLSDGRLKGVEVAASVEGTYLGDDRFEPFWSAAEASGALVFIHPTTRGFGAPVFQQYYLWNTVGNPLETTICAAHMITSGVMERHPRLKVLLAHGGGAALALRGRLAHAHGFQPQAKARLTEPVPVSLKRFYFDTLTHDVELLQALVEFAGPDHVLMGSDYPFDMGSDRPADIIRELGRTDEETERILGGNAARLLNLEVA